MYLNRLSGIYLRVDEIDKAIVITELNTQLFPDDGNIWEKSTLMPIKMKRPYTVTKKHWNLNQKMMIAFGATILTLSL